MTLRIYIDNKYSVFTKVESVSTYKHIFDKTYDLIFDYYDEFGRFIRKTINSNDFDYYTLYKD